MTHITLTDDEWEEQFRPIKNHLDNEASWTGTMFETYGAEFDYIQSCMKENRIWTYMDSEVDDSTLIIEGMHYVNRIGYFITEIPYNPDNTYEVEID